MTRCPPTCACRTELESSLEERFRFAIRSRGGRLYKLAPTDKGIPDRLVLLPQGRMYLVELKTTTGRLSPKQKHIHAQAQELGTTVVTLYGRHEIDEWVERVHANYRDVRFP